MIAFDPPRLTVYCGASLGAKPVYAEAVRTLGRLLLQHGLGVVYGGAELGLMGVIAGTVAEGGGEVIGIIPDFMQAKGLTHPAGAEVQIVDSMHSRKMKMTTLGAGFVALPGGLGTLDELVEALTWAQLGLHDKPIGLLNVEGYFDPFLSLLDHATREGFVKLAHRELLITASSPEILLHAMATRAAKGRS